MLILKGIGIVWLLVCTVLTMLVGRRLMKNSKNNNQFCAGFALTMCSLIVIGACLALA